MERLAKDKHSSLLKKSINYGRKKFYSTGPRLAYSVMRQFIRIKFFIWFAPYLNQALLHWRQYLRPGPNIIIISGQSTVIFDSLCSGPWSRTRLNQKKKNVFDATWLQQHYKLKYLFCGALYNQWQSKNVLFHCNFFIDITFVMYVQNIHSCPIKQNF